MSADGQERAALRIVYCIPSLDYGGAERQLAHLAGALRRRGHDVHVAFMRDGPMRGTLASAGVRLHFVGGGGNHDPRILTRLVRLLAALRPDVVQTCITQMDVLGGAAALLTRTPWVLRESSAAAMYPADWKHRLRRRLGPAAHAIVSNSAEGDAYWRDAGASVRHVVPNGIDLANIAGADDDGAGLTLPAGRPLVLFAGRMDDGKNVGTLVEALARIAPTLDFVAVLCGDGPRRRALEARVAALGLTDRLTFAGNVPEPWRLMKRAGALVSLSRFEGSPNVVLEAMACGCPLVVSDIPAHRAILDDRTAWFTPPDDPARAAAAIHDALTSAEAPARARAAAARAATWPVEETARQYEAIYRALYRALPRRRARGG